MYAGYGRRSKVTAVIVSICLLLQVSSATASCDWLFKAQATVATPYTLVQELWAKLWIQKQVSQFSYAKYQEAKTAFSETSDLEAATTLIDGLDTSVEAKIAWLEVHAQHAGLVLPVHESIQTGDWTVKRRWFKLLKRFQFEKPQSAASLASFTQSLFTLQYGGPISCWDVLLRDHGACNLAIQSKIEQYLNERIYRDGIVGIYEELGALQKDRLRERFNALMESPRAQLVLTLLFNLQILKLGLPNYLPTIRWVEIPKDALFRAADEGVEKVAEELLPQLRTAYRREALYSAFRSYSMGALLLVSGYVGYQEVQEQIQVEQRKQAQEQVDEMTRALEEQSRKLKEELEQQQNGPSIGEVLFEEWKKEQERKTGRPVDTTSAEYRDAYRIFHLPTGS